MTEADHKRARDVLAFALNLEHAGDVVARTLLALVTKRIKRGLASSSEAQAELIGPVDRLLANTRKVAALFVSEDGQLAASRDAA